MEWLTIKPIVRGMAMEQAASTPISGRIWVRSTRMASCTTSRADPSLTMAEN